MGLAKADQSRIQRFDDGPDYIVFRTQLTAGDEDFINDRTAASYQVDEEGTVIAFGPDYDEPTYRVQLETGPLIPEVLESSLVPVSASSRSRAHLRRQWTHIGYGPSGNERGY